MPFFFVFLSFVFLIIYRYQTPTVLLIIEQFSQMLQLGEEQLRHITNMLKNRIRPWSRKNSLLFNFNRPYNMCETLHINLLFTVWPSSLHCSETI